MTGDACSTFCGMIIYFNIDYPFYGDFVASFSIGSLVRLAQYRDF